MYVRVCVREWAIGLLSKAIQEDANATDKYTHTHTHTHTRGSRAPEHSKAFKLVCHAHGLPRFDVGLCGVCMSNRKL